MNVTRDGLIEWYSSLETDELIHTKTHCELTEIATEVIDEVLGKRGIVLENEVTEAAEVLAETPEDEPPTTLGGKLTSFILGLGSLPCRCGGGSCRKP